MAEPKVQIKSWLLILDEAAPSVGTTVALLGHQVRASLELYRKKKTKKKTVECCLVTAFPTLELPVLAGYSVPTAVYHTIITCPCPSPQGEKSLIALTLSLKSSTISTQSRLIRPLKGGNYNGTLQFLQLL